MAEARLQLLVVEDETALARLWAQELAHLADATLAHTLAAAREAVAARPFDVILLDLRLPDGNGLDFLTHLRHQGQGSRSQVIILTGHGDFDAAVGALRLGAVDFLSKPCKIGDIERLLNRARERSAARPVLPIPTIAEMELLMIRQALEAHGGNKTAAARALGISLRTLYNKLELLPDGGKPSSDR